MDLMIYLLDVAVGPVIVAAIVVLLLIIGVVLLLGFLAYKLIVKIKNNETNDKGNEDTL